MVADGDALPEPGMELVAMEDESSKAPGIGSIPQISTRNLSFKLRLIADLDGGSGVGFSGLNSVENGHSLGIVSAGLELAGFKPDENRAFEPGLAEMPPVFGFDELFDVLVTSEKIPKNRGRPRGSRNNKRLLKGLAPDSKATQESLSAYETSGE